jgi:hypothetical protein
MSKSNDSATAHASTNGAVNRVADKLIPPKGREVQIAAPNMQIAAFKIRGTSPYVQNKFSEKARQMMMATQAAGSTATGKKKRTPKDFAACCKEATYLSAKGEHGIPCAAFRAGMVSACKIVGFAMTRGKIALFVMSDINDGATDLVKITKGKPKQFEAAVRNDNGSIDIRSRPIWAEGWEATVQVRFDADMFTVTDIANLMARVGAQVGVGEGRADSKDSCGQGWGFFEIVNK